MSLTILSKHYTYHPRHPSYTSFLPCAPHCACNVPRWASRSFAVQAERDHAPHTEQQITDSTHCTVWLGWTTS
eukprot:7936509-Pyramimonas_sp.AAC.1